MPQAEQARDLARGDLRGILGQEAPLRHRIETAEQCEPLVGHQGHDVAFAFDGPQLESQRGAQRIRGRDHARARKLGAQRQRLELDMHQIGNEQEQPSHPGGELTRRQGEAAYIGHRFRARTDQNRALFVEPAWQRGKALRRQHLTHCSGAEWRSLLLERPADVVDRVVALAQRNDLLLSGAFPRLIPRTRPRRGEELRQRAAAKRMTQHAERPWRVAEALSRLRRREPFEIEGPQGLVLALARASRLGEEAPWVGYVIWCTDMHSCTLSHTIPCVKPILRRKPCALKEIRVECTLSRFFAQGVGWRSVAAIAQKTMSRLRLQCTICDNRLLGNLESNESLSASRR